MALAKKLSPPSKTGGLILKKKENVDKPLTLSLPTEPTEPSTNLGDYTILIHGTKKIGKTSLAAEFPDALALMFEPGGKALSMKQVPCPDWNHFRQYVDLIMEDQDACETVIVDTGALAYDACMRYVCAKANIEHPGDEGYGKGWERVKKELSTKFNLLMSRSGKGTLVLCHTKNDEVELQNGKKYNKMIPDLSGQASTYFAGIIDIIGYYHIIDNKRWLLIREDDNAVAGCRLTNNFLTPYGEQVWKIPMGSSAKEAYKNLVRAFNNQQKESYAPEGVKNYVEDVSHKTSQVKAQLKKKIALKKR